MGCELFNTLTRLAEGGFTRAEFELFGETIDTALNQDACAPEDLSLVDQQIDRTIDKFQHFMGTEAHLYLTNARSSHGSPYDRLHEAATPTPVSAGPEDFPTWRFAAGAAGLISGIGAFLSRKKLTGLGVRVGLLIGVALFASAFLNCQKQEP